MTLHNGEQALWLAVLHQAIQDATAKSIEPHLKQEAIAWLTQPNRDFDSVCESAGKDPVRLRKAVLQRMDTTGTPQLPSKPPAPQRRRRSPLITYGGKSMTIPEWARHLGIKVNTLHVRFAKGWTPEEALTRPLVQGRHRFAAATGRRPRGEASDFEEITGTGGGSLAQDLHEMGISPEQEATE